MVRACDFGQKPQRGATPCKTDFRAKRASVPDLAHVHENWAKTWSAHVILAKTQRWQNRVKRTFGQTGIGTRLCSCTPNLAHVHENWAKTWFAHVILAKKRVCA